MREAGRVSARALRLVGEAVAVGATTAELDDLAEAAIREDGGEPAFKGYHGFPKTLCTSINSQVVHGIPSEMIKLRDGDIISVDIGVFFGGLHTDAARTLPVGTIDEATQKLLDVTAASLDADVARRLWDVSERLTGTTWPL